MSLPGSMHPQQPAGSILCTVLRIYCSMAGTELGHIALRRSPATRERARRRDGVSAQRVPRVAVGVGGRGFETIFMTGARAGCVKERPKSRD
eukprot:1271040-Rhodomonas_salina.1